MVNGAGIEEWLEDLVSKAGNVTVVDTSRFVSLLSSPKEIEIPGGGAHDHDHGDAHGHHHHHHGGKNPHIWLDPVLTKTQVDNILKAFVKADPKNAESYQANAKRYLAELDQLHRQFQSTLAPLKAKNLVTFHDAFPYLAKRYGINYVGFIEEFPEKDPTPNQLQALVQAIRKNNVKVLFSEEGYAPKLLDTIAKETGAKVSQLDTLEVGAPAADAYLQRMRGNLAALKRAWSE